MPRIQPTVFVLWGERCDELVACTFVTVLRRAGLRVKLVGVSGRRNRGAYGLALTPDLPLHEAFPLASHAAAVVIPCEGDVLRRLMDNVQVVTFLEAAGAKQAYLMVQEEGPNELSLDWRDRLITYSVDQDLQQVVDGFGAMLLTK